jgi:hypothetical protein
MLEIIVLLPSDKSIVATSTLPLVEVCQFPNTEMLFLALGHPLFVLDVVLRILEIKYLVEIMQYCDHYEDRKDDNQ